VRKLEHDDAGTVVPESVERSAGSWRDISYRRHDLLPRDDRAEDIGVSWIMLQEIQEARAAVLDLPETGQRVGDPGSRNRRCHRDVAGHPSVAVRLE
jgi:hypothetical protein